MGQILLQENYISAFIRLVISQGPRRKEKTLLKASCEAQEKQSWGVVHDRMQCKYVWFDGKT